jgi:RNA polymerase sigma-70 factor (ECF subfamily)
MTMESEKQELNEIMKDYGDELVRLAFTYVRDVETAKDMVQNTFIKCYENLETFRHDSKLKTWLYRITINQCKDYLKSWNYRKVQTRNFIQEKTGTWIPSTENAVMDRENKQEIKDIILSLPKSYREVIFLYYYNSMKIDEISEITDMSTNTVKTRLRRAKQRLKTIMEEVEIYG